MSTSQLLMVIGLASAAAISYVITTKWWPRLAAPELALFIIVAVTMPWGFSSGQWTSAWTLGGAFIGLLLGRLWGGPSGAVVGAFMLGLAGRLTVEVPFFVGPAAWGAAIGWMPWTTGRKPKHVLAITSLVIITYVVALDIFMTTTFVATWSLSGFLSDFFSDSFLIAGVPASGGALASHGIGRYLSTRLRPAPGPAEPIPRKNVDAT
jgi:hypothetical protein